MFLAVSPYHLTTREPPAMAALLLAQQVVTLMPTPFAGAGREQVARAVEQVPRYFDLMKSWEWAIPLWERGLVTSIFEGQDAVDEVRTVCRRIQHEPSLIDLRSLMRPELFEDEENYLDAVARDLLKAGPDPAVSVPVVAGLDRFAARLGLVVARPEAASVAQKAEMRSARTIVSVAIPILVQAGAQTILAARRDLEDTIGPLGDALDILATEAARDDEPALDELIESVRHRARAYAAAFASIVATCGFVTADDEPRLVHAQAALSLVSLPVDAVLGSSVAAMSALGPPSRRRVAVGPGESDLAERDPLAGRRVMSLIVRPIGHRTARR
jgi:hypothetical protein